MPHFDARSSIARLPTGHAKGGGLTTRVNPIVFFNQQILLLRQCALKYLTISRGPVHQNTLDLYLSSHRKVDDRFRAT